MKKKVAFPFRHHASLVCAEAKQMLLDAGFELVCNDTGEKLSFEEQHAMIADAFAVIAGTERYDAEMLEGCSELKVIIRFGVGTDNFDLETMKKKGKLPYTPESVLEFYDDHFVEITPEARNEMNYSIVERVDVVSDKAIYIYVNSIMAYIVPRSCFYRDEEVASFIEYLRAKCKNIYFY